ncbi:SH3 domain-containing protein [Thiothrix sp.]|jgi:hypothetical protein|uniref:SH3 domain-containing protein n=1 Tax=Thiothrix sp. TaxID=1032 RepID=UPI00257BBF79|nr:SH3 domain-containing protein [Thiothrix sp.]
MTKPLTVFLSLFVAISTAAQADWYEVSAKPSLVVRGAPDTAADKVGNIPYGEKINVIDKVDKVATIDGQTGSWVKVQWKDSSGYVFDAFLTKSVSTPTSDKPVAIYDDSNEAKQDIKADTSSGLEIKTDQTNLTEKSTNETDTPDQTKIIVVTGYGTDHDKALKNALQSAVEQQVGVLIDSETIIKNDELIKNEILTASNGFVQKYDEVSTSSEDGLTEVKIKAEVKSQAVANKIKSLNISMLKVEDTSNIYAEITTKEKSKEDRKKMLEKTFEEILSEQNYTSLLEVKLEGFEILKDKTQNGKTPIEITYKVNFSYPAYEEIITKLEKTLEEISTKVKRKTDYPELHKIDDEFFRLKTSNGIEKVLDNSISIIKKNGEKYLKDTWEISNIDIMSLKKITPYPKNTVNIELLDKQGNLLDATKENVDIYRLYATLSYDWAGNDYSISDLNIIGRSRKIVFAPFISDGSYCNIAKTFKKTMQIDIERLIDFEKVTIQYQ